jgi:short-subunit dehydrogenase
LIGRRFEELAAIVTGARNGIGAAIGRRLAAEGARLAVIEIEGDALETAFADFLASAKLIRADDCKHMGALRRFVADYGAKFAPADALVNNVGKSARERNGRFVESSEKVRRFVLEVALVTSMGLTRLVVLGMEAEASAGSSTFQATRPFQGTRA